MAPQRASQPQIVEHAPNSAAAWSHDYLVEVRVVTDDRRRVSFHQVHETRQRVLTPQRAHERRREDDVANESQSQQEYVQGSIVASSINITGISSLIGYTRRHCGHFSAVPPLTRSTFVLQLGQARISSSSGSTAI